MDFIKIYYKTVDDVMKIIESKLTLTKQTRDRIHEQLKLTELFFSSNNTGRYVVLQPPIMTNWGVTEYPIQLHMDTPENLNFFLSTLLHEMAHIISISRLIQVGKNRFRHNWGICHTIYTFSDSDIEPEVAIHRNRDFNNENLNDLAGEYFFSQITSEKYFSKHYKNPIMLVCNSDDINEFRDIVQAYILNDYKKIKELLLAKSGCTDFRMLERRCRKLRDRCKRT